MNKRPQKEHSKYFLNVINICKIVIMVINNNNNNNPWAIQPIHRALAYQLIVDLTTNCPQTERKDHLASSGGDMWSAHRVFV